MFPGKFADTGGNIIQDWEFTGCMPIRTNEVINTRGEKVHAVIQVIPDKGQAVRLPNKMNTLGMKKQDVLVMIETIDQYQQEEKKDIPVCFGYAGQ